MELENGVYFINDIQPYFEDEEEISNADISNPSKFLMHVSRYTQTKIGNEDTSPELETYYLDKEIRRKIKAGHYISHLEYDNAFNLTNFENANSTKEAKKELVINNALRSIILNKQKTITQDSIEEINVEEVFSYHINVGHGNCSIIALKNSERTVFWMIDSSSQEQSFTRFPVSGRNYWRNIERCIDYLQKEFSVKDFHISKFFLTHPHFDHYNGVFKLSQHKHINSNTEFWVNADYSWPHSRYSDFLGLINKLGSPIRIPMTGNSFNFGILKILNPTNTIIRSMTPKYKNVSNVNVEILPNNASVIYSFSLNGKTIIFPGDIETVRWNRVNTCYPRINNANYYCISHHGSINGHLRNVCPLYPRSRINNLADCYRGKIAILMGRDKAYTGVISNQVLKDFRNRLYRTDSNRRKVPHFLELDWQKDRINFK